jgi:hypothetical protein
MIIASVSSFLLRVKSSASRARATSSGCTHTSRTPRSAVIWSSTRQRCPVGSHAATTWVNPACAAWVNPQLTASDSSHALHRTVRRARIFES